MAKTTRSNPIDRDPQDLLDKCFSLLCQIETTKTLYKELDLAIVRLREQGFQEGQTKEGKFWLVDNFREANVVFRPAGVRRYELKMEKL